MVKELIKKYYKEAILVCLLAILILIIFNFQVNRYDYIPERDTYHWLSVSNFINKYQGEYPSQPPQNFPIHEDWTYYRSFSFVLLNTSLSKICQVDIYKFYQSITASLFFGLLILAGFLLMKNLTKNRIFSYLFILLLALSSTILEEFARARPFMLTFALVMIVIYLINKYFENKESKYIIFSVIISLLAVFYHPANVILLIIIALSFAIYKINKKNRVYFMIAIGILLVLILLISLNITSFGLTKYLPEIKAFSINPYLFTWETYYGADYYLDRFVGINIVFLALGLLFAIYQLFKNKTYKNLSLVIFIFITYILIDLIYKLGFIQGEIYFYRGLSLFSLATLILVVFFIAQAKKSLPRNVVITLIAALLIFNLANLKFESFELVFDQEIHEINQAKNQISKQAIFISQYQAWPLVINYLDRTYFTLNDELTEKIFYAKSSQQAYQTIKNILTNKDEFEKQFSYATYQKNYPRIAASDFYILYSKKSKAKPYIKETNLPDAKLDSFGDPKYFELIYQGQEISIWKIKLNQ